MIDFVRIQYKDKFRFEPFVCREENFDSLLQTIEAHTGEIRYPYRAKKENMDVVICNKTGYVKNSIHKLNNVLNEDIEHNYDDFTYSMLCETIKYLSNEIIDVSTNGLTQLEFGLNVNINIPAKDIIEKNVLMHNFHGHRHDENFKGKGKLKQFDYTNYFIKIYDKAKQYGRDENILRFEIKFIRRREFNALGVYNLNDLLDKQNLRRLFLMYMRRFNEMIILDSINDISRFDEGDYEKLIKFKNPYYWEVEMKSYSGQTVSRHKKQFNDLIEKYQLDTRKKEIKKLLIEKFIHLINN